MHYSEVIQTCLQFCASQWGWTWNGPLQLLDNSFKVRQCYQQRRFNAAGKGRDYVAMKCDRIDSVNNSSGLN